MKYEENVWYGWNGGECPVHPETAVEYVYISEGLPIYDEDAAKYVRWDKGYPHPVIAFRVIKEHREPREWYVVVNQKGQVMGCNEWHLTSSIAEELGQYTLIHVREVLE